MQNVRNAPFIAIEGIDGAGTTTQTALLEKALQADGHKVWSTCEPTRTPLGAFIRAVLAGTHRVSPDTLAYLFAADRHEHLYGTDGILERTKAGIVVLCDRYKYSSLAYQTLFADRELVYRLNDRFPDPDALVYVDLKPAAGEQRLSTRKQREIFEHLELQQRVYRNYEPLMAEAERSTTLIAVNGANDATALSQKIYEGLRSASIL